jgi:glutathione S-transferase
MRLYHRWACPWCAAARQGAANVGVDIELVVVPRPHAERTEVLAVSGQPRVPVLVDDDLVVVGSRAIVRHLYRAHGGGEFDGSAADLDREVAVLTEAGLEEVAGGTRALPDRARADGYPDLARDPTLDESAAREAEETPGMG